MSEDRSRALHNRNALAPGTLLGEYVLVSAREEGRGEGDELGSGGFGIVYLARHRNRRDWLFAIKEYFPQELVVRDRENGESVWPATAGAESALSEGLSRFRLEADQLRRLRNERHVVSCVNYFEANGTSYLVMDYDDGVPLSKYLWLRESKGRPLGEEDLLAVALPLLDGLSAVHGAEVLHRDIKPGNVFVRREDDSAGRPAEPVLMDFGAAKQEYLSRHSRSQAPYTPGYAAWEQVSGTGKLSPATDLYGVGALLWRMVAGGADGHPGLVVSGDEAASGGVAAGWSAEPQDVIKRIHARYSGEPDPMPSASELGAGRFSEPVLEAIDRCLALDAKERPQSCEDLAELLRGVSPVAIATVPEVSVGAVSSGDVEVVVEEDSVAVSGSLGESAVLAPRRRRLALVGLGVAGLLAVVLMSVTVMRPAGDEGPAPEELLRRDELASPPSEAEVEADEVPLVSVETPVSEDVVASPPSEAEVEADEVPLVSVETPVSEDVRASLASGGGVVGGSAILVVETEPSGAEVLVNGEAVGETPFERTDLRGGDWEVTLRHPHYETMNLPAQSLSAGRVLRIERVLTRGRGALTVLTEPTGAWVELGDERLSEGTPVTLEGLPAGAVTLRLGAVEHRVLDVVAEVPKGGVGRLERSLDRILYGSLTLELVPADASVEFTDSSLSYESGMRLPEGGHRKLSTTLTQRVSGFTESLLQSRWAC